MDYLKISADDHIDLAYLPHDIWTERVPKALRAAAPHIEHTDKGQFWMCEDKMWSEYRTAEWFARPGRNPLALDRGGVGEEGRPVNTAKRLEDMARDGVEATVMFPPIVSLNPSDPALRDAIVAGYNDWAADFGDSAPGQFFPVALLSPADPKAATAEMLRIAKDGRLKQVNFLVNDVTTEMHFADWDVFWDNAAETGMLVSYHAGGSIQTNTMRDMQTRMVNTDKRAPVFGMGLGDGGRAWFDPFVNLFTFGTLERRPTLRFIFAESDMGWMPYVVEQMDLRYNRLFETIKESDVSLKIKPSEVFKQQVYVTYQTDAVGLHLLDFFGEGHVMWASDYPHHDSTWPFSQDFVDRETAHLTSDRTRAVVRDNAAALYGVG
jgi:uncharacterized protein